MKLYTKLFFVFFLLMLAFSFVSFGQGGDAGCDPLCNCRADHSICPIDSGLSALLIIGVGYGIKKYKDSRNSSKNSQKTIP